MEQVEDQLYLTAKEVTHLLDKVTQSITEDLLADSMKMDEYSTQPLLPTQIYAAIGCGIFIWGTNNQLIEANGAAQRMLDMSFYELQQHLTAHPGGVFLCADGTPLALEKQSSTLAWRTGIAQHNVLEGFLRPDGKCCWLQVDALPMKDMEGMVIGVVASFMDVTTHVEAAQHAQQKEERLHTIISHAPAIIYAMDRTGIITLLEGNGLEMLRNNDVTSENVISSVFDLYRDVPEVFDNVRRALNGESFTTIHEVAGYMLESHFMPVQNQDNEVTSIICVATDVTEHIVAEQAWHSSAEQLTVEHERLETALHSSEERFEMIVSSVPVVLNTYDRSGMITLSIGGGLVPLGRAPGESVGHSVYELYSTYPALLNDIHRALAGETFSSVTRVLGRVFNTRFMPILDQHNEVNSLVSISVDITERDKAEESLQEKGQIYQALSEQATDLVLITDAEGRFLYLSPSHQRILGYDPEVLLNKNVFAFIHPEDRKQVKAAFSLAFRDSEIVAKTAFHFLHANGTWVILECTGRNCLQDPAVKGFIVNARDITGQIKMEETLRHQALHDALTDLPNRTFLQKRLEQAIMNAERQHNSVALLIMDLDRFKEINDTFGHQHGDLLLQQVSTRLVQAIGSAGIVSRLGGDEFAILLPKADEESTGIIAEQLRYVLEEPFMVAGYPLNVEASVGIVLYPLHGTDGLTLMRRADVAMYAAKSTHEGVAFYKATHDDQYSSRRLALIGALRQAIAANELTLYYQPKVNLKTGLTSSVEALARWQHPIHGLVPPDQFITLAEQTGLINALTAWALETAVRQCRVWLQSGLSLSVAVNLSSWNLRDVTLPETIMSLLTRYSVPSQLLRVELTESAIMTDTDRALDILHRLSALGIHISVDDFGTGYSSLAYLKRLPVDELKIDRSFVQHMLEVEADATIVRSTIMLAHNLGLHVVAEGVEDEATLNLLADFECDFAQGYYMSCPLSAVELERWLRTFPQLVTR